MKTVGMTRPYPHAGAYVRAWRALLAFAGPDTTRVNRSGDFPKSVADLRAEYAAALLARIMARGGQARPRGRKDSVAYFYAAVRDQQALRAKRVQRVRVYQFETAECQRRFGHLLDERGEI